MIDGNMTMRTELKEWICDIDTRDPKVLQVMRDGYVVWNSWLFIKDTKEYQ